MLVLVRRGCPALSNFTSHMLSAAGVNEIVSQWMSELILFARNAGHLPPKTIPHAEGADVGSASTVGVHGSRYADLRYGRRILVLSASWAICSFGGCLIS